MQHLPFPLTLSVPLNKDLSGYTGPVWITQTDGRFPHLKVHP